MIISDNLDDIRKGRHGIGLSLSSSERLGMQVHVQISEDGISIATSEFDDESEEYDFIEWKDLLGR